MITATRTSLITLLCCFALPPSPHTAFAQNTLPKPVIEFKRSQSLGLPLACSIGTDCWVMNYVDMDEAKGTATDPNCQNRTYDTHKGTDFAILDEKAMNKGVPVFATKDGSIVRFRDGENDNWKTKADLEKIKSDRKECGNAILIKHDDNTQSIYCHLKQNSITVKENQRVKKGDSLAMVGMSGLTEFPHLHYGLLKNKKVVDPFTGKETAHECGIKSPKPLWDKDLPLSYKPFVIQSAAFSNTIPTLDSIGQDASPLDKITLTDTKLIFWTALWGVRVNDKITLEITDANNKVIVSENITQDRNSARQLYYIGKKLDTNKLPEGVYTGKVKLTRTDEKQDEPPLSDFKIGTILITKK